MVRFGKGAHGLALLLLPVLHDHGYTGSAAAVRLLFHKRDVNPYAAEFGSEKNATQQLHQENSSEDDAWHSEILVYCNDDQDEGSDAYQDNQQVVVVHSSSSEVSLCLVRTGRKLRKFVVT